MGEQRSSGGAAPRRGRPTRHPCRGGVARLAVALALGVTTTACRTTHTLGDLADPRASARLREAVGARPMRAGLEPVGPVRSPPRGYDVTSIEPSGLRLQLGWPAPTLVPLPAISAVSTYDHARGARDGALAAGIPVFVIATALAGLVAAGRAGGCADQCPPSPDPVPFGLRVGAVVGLGAAVVGAGFGALVGHEDRYVFTGR